MFGLDIDIGGIKPFDPFSGFGLFGDSPGEQAADAAKDAAKTQAAYQQQALDYLKEREKIPQYIREQALQQLGGLYGIQYPSYAQPETQPGTMPSYSQPETMQDRAVKRLGEARTRMENV